MALHGAGDLISLKFKKANFKNCGEKRDIVFSSDFFRIKKLSQNVFKTMSNDER